MRLSTDLLREYLAFSESMNFTAAARNLHMSPSTLNRHVLELEKEVGRRLFVRGRQVTLTRVGRKLLDVASDILYQESCFVEFLEKSKKQDDEMIHIYNMIGFTGFTEFITSAVACYTKQFPSVSIRIRTLPDNHDPINALVDGVVDIACTLVLGKQDDAFCAQEQYLGCIQPLFLQRPLGVYMEKGHRLAGSSVSIRDLKDERIIMPITATYRYFRNQIEKLCEQHGFSAHFDFRDAASFIDCYVQPANGSVYLQMIDGSGKRFIPSSLVENDELIAVPLQDGIYVKPAIVFRTDSISDSMAALLDLINERGSQ